MYIYIYIYIYIFLPLLLSFLILFETLEILQELWLEWLELLNSSSWSDYHG